MTNEYGAGKLSIMKCDQCRDGYLIVKPGRDNSYFLGCTNYKRDGSGCSKVISNQQYYEMLGLTPNSVENREVPKIKLDTPKHVPIIRTPIENKASSVGYNTKETTRVFVKMAEVDEVLYKDTNLNYVVHTILQCVSDMSLKQYYGVTVLIDVLRGSQSQRIQQKQLYKLEQYGALVSLSREDLEAIVEWMLDMHFVLKTKGQYPVLHPTYEGTHYDQLLTYSHLEKLHAKLTKK